MNWRLGSGIAARSRTGFVFDGGIRDAEENRRLEGFNGLYRASDPSAWKNMILTSINAPIRIGRAAVLLTAYSLGLGVSFLVVGLAFGRFAAPLARCPSCQAALNPSQRFCSSCGQIAAMNAASRCAQCQAELQPRKRFCTNCGVISPSSPCWDRFILSLAALWWVAISMPSH